MIKVYRLEQTDQGALGAIVLDGQYFCSSLEPDDQDPVKHQIPEGLYEVRRFHGTKWPDTYEIVVPGHTAVLFHSGCIEENTLMCVLLGQYPGKLLGNRAVLNSGATFKRFMEHMTAMHPEGCRAEFINL